MDIIQTFTFSFAFISLLITLSYYILIFLPKKIIEFEKEFNSISIIIPARNEEPYIRQSISAALNAKWTGKKEIFVIDDGSIDRTKVIAESFGNRINLISHSQKGKSASINVALKKSKGQLIAIIDGDSIIGNNSLVEMKKEIENKNVAAVTCPVLVANRKKGISMWSHLEQLQNSLIRMIFSKANAIITTPGPLAMYRTNDLKAIGGFSTEGFAEDADVTIRLARKGHKIAYAEKAYSKTYMPTDPKGFFRQRFRFAKGMLNLFKRHLRLGKHPIDYYAFPLLIFFYLQAVIMGSLTIYQIISGYNQYFLSNGIIFDYSVLQFFFGWFTFYGFANWSYQVLAGIAPLTIVSAIGIISSILSYPLFLIAILKYDKGVDLWHIIPFFFLFPFWLLIMIIYIICIPELMKKEQYNMWKKNEH